ncbi:predicted protein [Chaetoceros tenuissimus]|uniref:Uncharacterized protein n=1 Tax=Chaetoceros tenuissimus TaxID=426638 RepID=A0AAD3CL09_9STRA|nr:predicted protein [Chaetoceros tenuissimus]
MKKGKSRSAILSSSSSSFPSKKISALHDSNTMKMKKGMPTGNSRESIALRNHIKITNTRLPTCAVVSGAIMSKREIILENDPSLVKPRAFHFYPTATRDHAQPHLFQNKVSAPRPDPLKELKEAFQRAILDQNHVKANENDLKKKKNSASCNSNPHTKGNGKETQRATKFNHYGVCNISKEEADYLLWLLE